MSTTLSDDAGAAGAFTPIADYGLLADCNSAAVQPRRLDEVVPPAVELRGGGPGISKRPRA